MKINISILAGLILIMSACGDVSIIDRRSPTIARRSLSAGAEGAYVGLMQVIAKADKLSGPEADDNLAALLLKTQLDLIKINDSSSSLSLRVWSGHCLAHAASTPFAPEDLDSNLELSKGSRVAYSKSGEMKASDCQAFFLESIGPKVRKDFFDLHISFYSLSF